MTIAAKKLAGPAAPPIAWATTTQLGQILPHSDCAKGAAATLVVVVVATLVALTGLAMSYPKKSEDGRPGGFLAYLGPGVGLVFTLALLLQTMAALSLNPCLR